MARKLLSMDAIRFIIECRNDPSQVYTWQDIADLVQTRFDIKVSGQAVGQSYKKYKDSFSSTTEKVQLTTQPVVKDIKATVNPTKAFNRIQSDSKKTNGGFNENAGEQLTKDDLKDLL